MPCSPTGGRSSPQQNASTMPPESPLSTRSSTSLASPLAAQAASPDRKHRPSTTPSSALVHSGSVRPGASGPSARRSASHSSSVRGEATPCRSIRTGNTRSRGAWPSSETSNVTLPAGTQPLQISTRDRFPRCPRDSAHSRTPPVASAWRARLSWRHQAAWRAASRLVDANKKTARTLRTPRAASAWRARSRAPLRRRWLSQACRRAPPDAPPSPPSPPRALAAKRPSLRVR